MSTEDINMFKESGNYIQSLDRGLQVIQAFSQKEQALTISDVSKITGLSRPTARRILLTLEHLGFAESKNNAYSLTARTLLLGYAYLSSNNIWNIADPFMREFVAQTGESCSISILDGTHIIYVARVSTKRIMSINLNVGSRLPAYATSMGHVLLANLPKEELDMYLEEIDLEKYTNKTISNKQELLHILEAVREKGWGGVDQQLEEGLRSIAVPIRNGNGKVIAAINCSSHAGRVTQEVQLGTFLPLLQECAEKIGAAIHTTNNSSYL